MVVVFNNTNLPFFPNAVPIRGSLRSRRAPSAANRHLCTVISHSADHSVFKVHFFFYFSMQNNEYLRKIFSLFKENFM